MQFRVQLYVPEKVEALASPLGGVVYAIFQRMDQFSAVHEIYTFQIAVHPSTPSRSRFITAACLVAVAACL